MKEQYFREFFKKSPTAYSCHRVILDEQGLPEEYEFIEVNEAYENMSGLKASNFVGKRFYEVFPHNWEDGVKWYETFQDAAMNNKTVHIDIWIDKWLRITIFPVGEYTFACMFTDITKEHMKGKEIEGFLKVNLDMLCVVDTNCNILRVNKKFENVLGYKIDELEGKNFLSLVHEDDIPATLKAVRDLEAQLPVEVFICSCRCKDGSYRNLEFTAQPNGKYIYASARDVTEKRKAETELLINTQNELITRIIENLDIPLARCTYPEFNFVDINHKAYGILKQLNPGIGPLSSVIGQNMGQLHMYNNKDEIIDGIRNSIAKNGGSYFAYRKLIVDGEEKTLKSIYQPLFELNNKIVEIIVVSIDVTEEVKAKNKMEETIKMQDEIFSNISHELKTPLNVVFSANQLMELYLKNDSLEANREKISKSISIIKQNCYRFTKLINNIVDLSRIDSGFFNANLSNENIVDVIEDIVQSVSSYIKAKGLSIVFDTNTEEKVIACDPYKIERIILNLISNAVKFTNPGGSIFVNVLDKVDTVEIVVKDTGIGIDNDHLNNIFERFHQVDNSLSRNAEGSGIGLFLVKSIVDLHGGKISAESKAREGSIFRIELPVRNVKNTKVIEKLSPGDNKIKMINIEFSDIYTI